MKTVSDFAEQKGGYADCLLNINSAAMNGENIDFSDWEEARYLASVETTTLSAVINLFRDFHSFTIARHQRKSQKKIGKPRISMPDNFAEQARMWGDGKISAVKAAKNCGVPYHTFISRARELLSCENTDKRLVWDAWKKGELSVLQAANRLGCSSREFRRLARRNSSLS